MGSLIMHVIISNQIRQKYDYSYDFMYGSIMPDILKKAGEDKNKVHYRIKDNYYLYDLNKFVKENLQEEKSEYSLGYLAHLIQDKLLANYINTKIKESIIDSQEYMTYLFDNNTLHKKQEFLDLIHNDYALIDDYLIKKYDINMDYITKRLLRVNKEEKYEKIIEDELKMHEIISDSRLKLFTILDVEQYIRDCINEYDRYIEEEL